MKKEEFKPKIIKLEIIVRNKASLHHCIDILNKSYDDLSIFDKKIIIGR